MGKHTKDKKCQQGCGGVASVWVMVVTYIDGVSVWTMTALRETECVSVNNHPPVSRFDEQLFSRFYPVSSTLPLLSKLSRTPTERAHSNENREFCLLSCGDNWQKRVCMCPGGMCPTQNKHNSPLFKTLHYTSDMLYSGTSAAPNLGIQKMMIE